MVPALSIRREDDRAAVVADRGALAIAAVKGKLLLISSVSIGNEKLPAIRLVAGVNDSVIGSPRDSINAVNRARGDPFCAVRRVGKPYPDVAGRIPLPRDDRPAVRRY